MTCGQFLMYFENFPTRLHVDVRRGHAGAVAVMLADSHSVELATFQVRYFAVGCSGTAA